MKILLLNEDFPPLGQGGGATICASLAKGYADHGHDVTVLTTHRNDRDIHRWETDGYRVESLPLDYKPGLRPYLSLCNAAAERHLRTFFHDKTFDVAHAHNVHHHLTYRSLAHAKRVSTKLVVTFHDVMSVSYGRLSTGRFLKSGPDHFEYRLTMIDRIKQAGLTFNPFRNIVIRRYLKHADHRIAVSEALRDALETNGLRIDGVIRNGIDEKSVRPAAEKMQEMRREWNPDGAPLIFFGGRLSADKGLFQLLDAFRLIQKDLPEAKILLAGDRTRADSLLRHYPHSDAIRSSLIVTGWLGRDELVSALALSDVCVTPSVCFDSFPTVNLEAMALAKPVIATQFGGSKELVQNGETGFIINPFDTSAFADRLATLLSHPDQARAMGKAGLERVRVSFSLDEQVRAYLQLLQAA